MRGSAGTGRATGPSGSAWFASAGAVGYALAPMAERKVTDAATMLAELREQVHHLDERVTEFGRHL